jgi:biopolymer transport protein ExbD
MFYYKKPRQTPTIAMAPLIDMVFLLLIFFMVATVFPDDVGVEVEKPEADTAKALPKQNLLFAITAQGALYHGGETITFDEATAIIGAAIRVKPETAVIVEPDKLSYTKSLVDFLDTAREAGATNIAIATEDQR